jgi:hypothetical protein
MSSRQQREAHAAALALRTDLEDRVQLAGAHRLNTCRAIAHSDSLSHQEVARDLPGTIQLGFNRALVTRFETEREITTDWWVEKRQLHAKHGQDRANDHLILNTYYPEFEEYYPVVAITDDEIVIGTVDELTRWVSAPGTDYHQTNAEQRLLRAGLSTETEVGAISHGANHPRYSDGSVSDYRDRHAHQRIDLILDGNDPEDDSMIFGKYGNRIGVLAMREYGPVYALYWICERFFFQKRYSDVLRIVGGTEEQLGIREFERVKRHMARNFPAMTAHMIEILRNDPIMAEMRIERVDLNGLQAETHRREVSDERKLSDQRAWRAMLRRIQNEPTLAGCAEWLQHQSAQTQERWVVRFRRCSHNEEHWQDFRRSLARRV